MTSYMLIPATPNDKNTLYRIHRLSMIDMVTIVWGWDEPVQARMFDTYFDSAQLQVIKVEGNTVGYLDTRCEVDHDFITNIILHPDMQGRGIGTAILRNAVSISRQREVPLRLQVLKINARARELYERLGFVVTGDSDTHFAMEFHQ